MGMRKMELVQKNLKEQQDMLSEEKRNDTFKGYIPQQLNAKLTQTDLLSRQEDPQHQFRLKQCNLDTLCVKKNPQQNADFLVSNNEGVVRKFQMIFSSLFSVFSILCCNLCTFFCLLVIFFFSHGVVSLFLTDEFECPFGIFSRNETTKVILCMILLCILKWKSYCQKKATLQNTKKQVSFFTDMIESDYCEIIKMITSVEKIDYFGTFAEEVSKCWTNRAVEIGYKCTRSQTDVGEEKERPHISINIYNRHGSRGWVPRVGTPPFFLTINAFEWGHVVETPPLFWVRNPPFLIWLDAPLYYCEIDMEFFSEPTDFLVEQINKKSDIHDSFRCHDELFTETIPHRNFSIRKLIDETSSISFYYKRGIIHWVITYMYLMSQVIKYPAKTTDLMREHIQTVDTKTKSKLLKMQVLLMMLILIVGTVTGHHKSAKLKKYLSIKYEYDMASLYLLWCSGDIEVHPGPSLNKMSLAHDSVIERRWLQNISPKILVLLQSKYTATKVGRENDTATKVGRRKNDTATKEGRKNNTATKGGRKNNTATKVGRKNNTATKGGKKNNKEKGEHFQTLVKKCLDEKVHVPKQYLAEINAWKNEKYKLLHKLFVFRCEIEAIITSLIDVLTHGGCTKDLTDINFSYHTELKTKEIKKVLRKYQSPEDKSQLIVYITRYLAGISIKYAHGKDPDTKCDGLWDQLLPNWPKDITLFDPNNRGKYKYTKLISDQDLVDKLIPLHKPPIPQKYKYKDIVEAYKVMRKNKTKQHKEELCNIFKRITSVEKIDYSLRNLCKNGIFTEEVHNILSKWWTNRAVEIGYKCTLSQTDVGEEKERPHISINISTTCISIESSSHVKYDFPFKDDLVSLKTWDTEVNEITTPSSDLKTPDTNPLDNQTDSITIPQEAMDTLSLFISLDHNGHVQLQSEIKLQDKTSTQDPASCSMTHLDQSISPTFQFSHSNTQTAVSGQLVSITCASAQSTLYADDQGNSIFNATNVSQNQSSSMGLPGSMTFTSSEAVLNSEHQFNTAINVNQLLMTNSDNSSDNDSNTWIKPNMGSHRKRKGIVEDIDGDQLRDSKKSLLSTQMKEKKKTVPRPVNKQTETDQNQIVPLADNSSMVKSNMNWLQDCQSIDFDSLNSPYLSADEIIALT